jgi:hypothetical protein
LGFSDSGILNNEQGITNVEVLFYPFLVQYFLFDIHYSKIPTKNESILNTFKIKNSIIMIIQFNLN